MNDIENNYRIREKKIENWERIFPLQQDWMPPLKLINLWNEYDDRKRKELNYVPNITTRDRKVLITDDFCLGCVTD